MTFGEFAAEVSRLLQEQYGLTWDDACGDLDPLQCAWETEETPQEFVKWWAEKYDLAPTR